MYISDHLRREVHDLHELRPQFAGNGADGTGAAWVVVVVEQHERVAIEADVAAVFTPRGDAGANDHALDHITGLHFAAGDRLLHARPDDVAQVRNAALVAA